LSKSVTFKSIGILNNKKEETIGKIYWDIEAQKFLIE
jgi:hypothetical protein